MINVRQDYIQAITKMDCGKDIGLIGVEAT
jgi:hypothetical protein